MTMNAENKSTTVRREITLHELVIPDLQHMDGTGKYDRNVLLWMQDAFVIRAMKENVGDLVTFHRELTERDDLTNDERWWCKTEFLGKITKETYALVKADGDGVGGKRSVEESYIDAARAFYQAESTVYAGQLQELAEYIKKSLESGVQPDLERFAKDAFVSMARMSDMSESVKKVENSGVKPAAQQIITMMQRGIEAINYAVVSTPGQSIQVGRELLKIVKDIGDNPRKYIEFTSSRMLKAGPFDFEPPNRATENGLTL